jgi:hypothetical protein
MSIRIRVYPQPGSVGARRNRAIRQQRQLIQRQQLQLAFVRQQQLQQQMYGGQSFGTNVGLGFGYAPSAGYGSYGRFGSTNAFPAASSWGAYGPATLSPVTRSCPPVSYGSSAYVGANQFGANAAYGYGTTSPFGVAQYAGAGFGWFGGW